jgi:hypothetical protein
MTDIIEFLGARLDEDEAASLDSLEHDPYSESWANILATRILLECVVKRKVIAHFKRIDRDYAPAGDQDYMEKFLFIIAEPYMDHPDFDPDWRH